MVRTRADDSTDPTPKTDDDLGERSVVLHWFTPGEAGHVARLTTKTTVVGRGEEAQIRFEGAQVSRAHAAITREGPLVTIRDLDSRNGTFVDGERVTHAPITPGSVLRIGEWTGVVAEEIVRAAGDPTLEVTSTAELLVGRDLASTLARLRTVATTMLPIVIEGDTGTGKECVARAIHTWSARRGPFVGVNCAALPEGLAEAELFGHAQGAFTGAQRARPGYIQSADGGTLLLDEVLDLPASLQAKLLRALDRGEVVPLGESRPRKVDVRVVAAAQGSLHAAVSEGRFRADLQARLAGLTVRLPPLRARRREIPPLFTELVRRHGGGVVYTVEPLVFEALCLYDWPGNVRELKHVVENLLAVSHAGLIRRADLPDAVRVRREHAATGAVGAPARPPRLTRQAVLDRSDELGGNLTLVARAFDVPRATFYRLLPALGLTADEARRGRR